MRKSWFHTLEPLLIVIAAVCISVGIVKLGTLQSEPLPPKCPAVADVVIYPDTLSGKSYSCPSPEQTLTFVEDAWRKSYLRCSCPVNKSDAGYIQGK